MLEMLQQARIIGQTDEKASSSRSTRAEIMANWRDAEEEAGREERWREDRKSHTQMRELRLLQEDTDELQRAFHAQYNTIIVPELPQQELEVLVERQKLRSKNFWAKKIMEDESKVHRHD